MLINELLTSCRNDIDVEIRSTKSEESTRRPYEGRQLMWDTKIHFEKLMTYVDSIKEFNIEHTNLDVYEKIIATYNHVKQHEAINVSAWENLAELLNNAINIENAEPSMKRVWATFNGSAMGKQNLSNDEDPRNQTQDDADFESDKDFLMREKGRDFINNITPDIKALTKFNDDQLIRAMLLHNPSKIKVIYGNQVLQNSIKQDFLLGKVEEISDDGNEEIKEALTGLLLSYYGTGNSALKYFIRQLSSGNIHDILSEYHRHRDYISSYKGNEADLAEEFRVLKEFDRYLNVAQTYNQAAKNQSMKRVKSSRSR